MARYAADIDGFQLEIETISDGFKKAVAVYEYPYRDGAKTDDLGAKARTLRLRCYWWEDTYQEHFDFLDHLKQRELFTLRHPEYGPLQGRIESLDIRHDDRQDLAEVDLSFIQDISSQESEAFSDVLADGEESFVAGLQEQQDVFVADAVTELGPVARDLAAVELDPELDVVEQFPSATLKVRNWLKTVDAAVRTWDQQMVDFANPANSLLAATSFATNLPGRVIGSVARAAERYALAFESQRTAPARFLTGVRVALLDFAALDATHGKQARIASAQRLGLEAATLYQQDETARDKLRQAEKTAAFDQLGRFTGAKDLAEVMSAIDLERSLAEVRGVLQEVIDEERGLNSLKDIARQLLEHVSSVKLERDRIERILLDNPLPLHLVCLRQGLPYSYAARLLSINSIPHPNFTQGEVAVYVR